MVGATSSVSFGRPPKRWFPNSSNRGLPGWTGALRQGHRQERRPIMHPVNETWGMHSPHRESPTGVPKGAPRRGAPAGAWLGQGAGRGAGQGHKRRRQLVEGVVVVGADYSGAGDSSGAVAFLRRNLIRQCCNKRAHMTPKTKRKNKSSEKF